MSRSDKLWSLVGGVHPPENKGQSNRQPLQHLPLSETVVLPLQQSNGIPAEPTVAVGDFVVTGQLIAIGKHPIATRLHATLTGEVIAIEDHVFAHPSGISVPSIIIKRSDLHASTDTHDSSLEPWYNWEQLPVDALLMRIEAAGISGLGGAGFPTHIKYLGQRPIHTLIVNGIECEPYITADDRLMREHAAEIITGIQIALRMLSAQEAIVGIEDNKPEAISAIRTAITAVNDARLVLKVIPTRYPSGGEKQLLYILTGEEVPSGDIPASLGYVIQNVGTLFAMQQAVQLGQPLIERVVTLTGDAVAAPGNYWIRIGTPIDAVLEMVGLTTQDTDIQRIIMGGPMMGFTLPNAQVPVSKTTNCLLIPTKQEMPDNPEADPCIRCGLCEQACPVSLLPQKLYWNAINREWDQAQLNSIQDCIECGACSWVCPSSIPLVQHYRFTKAEIKREAVETVKANQSRIRFENRQLRLEKEVAEKEIKRQARAAQAAQAQSVKAQTGDTQLDTSAKDAILASVARAKAKKNSQVAVEPKDSLESLQGAVTVALQAVEKTKVKLAAAQAGGLPSVTALTTALEKLEKRAQVAEVALATYIEKTGDPS